MKYIRTKDGIYDLEKSLFHQYNGIRVLTPYCKQYEENPSLCKTADTIEELCDEFVQINKSKDKDLVRIKKIDGGVYYQKLERVFDNEWHRLSAGEYTFGAIWTGKGLIYVAKMKSKGELELL